MAKVIAALRIALTPASDGNFYATTDIGPTGLLGTIFPVAPSGVFTTLHDFSSPPNADPMGPLLQAFRWKQLVRGHFIRRDLPKHTGRQF